MLTGYSRLPLAGEEGMVRAPWWPAVLVDPPAPLFVRPSPAWLAICQQANAKFAQQRQQHDIDLKKRRNACSMRWHINNPAELSMSPRAIKMREKKANHAPPPTPTT